jgi:hypothetical protein
MLPKMGGRDFKVSVGEMQSRDTKRLAPTWSKSSLCDIQPVEEAKSFRTIKVSWHETTKVSWHETTKVS